MTLTMIFFIYTNHQENIFGGHISFEKKFDIFPLKFSAENLSITRNVYSLGLVQIMFYHFYINNIHGLLNKKENTYTKTSKIMF
jgi:hypothetical protein